MDNNPFPSKRLGETDYKRTNNLFFVCLLVCKTIQGSIKAHV